jgi:hypothetical protein
MENNMPAIDDIQEIVIQPPNELSTKTSYSVEFFHIYTDETIGSIHTRSIEYLKETRDIWNVDASTVILIDNYNPTTHTLTPDDVIKYLDAEGCKPGYWAYEASLVANAEKLLGSLTDGHLERNYRRYIINHDKYPCSLLTATWYLTRLGIFEPRGIIQKCAADEEYVAAQYLINILPEVYKPIEKRAHELISASKYASYSNYIQALFYPSETNRALDLF